MGSTVGTNDTGSNKLFGVPPSPELLILFEIYLVVLHLETCGTADTQKVIELKEQILKLKPIIYDTWDKVRDMWHKVSL